MSKPADSNHSHTEDSDYLEKQKSRKLGPRKRQKLSAASTSAFEFPTDILLNLLDKFERDVSFEDTVQPLLPEFIKQRHAMEVDQAEYDAMGRKLRPLRAHEVVSKAHQLEASLEANPSTANVILRRKLVVQSSLNKLGLSERKIQAPNMTVTPLPAHKLSQPDPEVLDALYSIRTTPFHTSFISRLHGTPQHPTCGLISVDWETQTPWMELLEDIREHYCLAHPERDQPVEQTAPLTYTTLQPAHLDQIHDLLERSFWAGIDVGDSLDYQPEKATIVAMYKKLVIGVAILKSPMETYIMYLAVKAGWDRSQIARTMLYHLITMNPGKDISLHVSTNNSAMLLYNQFGFKAEEFVAGFYAKYQDPRSTLSNNAFKLRLRHLPI
ncbi:hypothetical protein CPB83DRAFT_691704 [Crepidotus variabilis]|uniref:N-acetyltransferase domain-containing protein n=1 Tax=Crepidotus variabilis TaxID=179855 RepID=A0A9P6E6L8_9AGAR|nr:hypothetical protein CPB83DRAFT_691704 [Crepidotus variabilis]